MTQALIHVTANDDGSAEFTISVNHDHHQFSASQDGTDAVVSYEESCTYRGETRVAAPPQEVIKLLVQSPEMTRYLESNDLTSVHYERT